MLSPTAQGAAILFLPTAAGMASLVPKSLELFISDFIACNTPSTLVAPESDSSCEREDFLGAGGRESGRQCLWVREVEVSEWGEERETGSLQLLHILKAGLLFQLPKHIFDLSSESGLDGLQMRGFVG